MIKFFKQNDIGTAFALVFFTFLLKAKYIFQPPKLTSLDNFHQGLLFSFEGLRQFYTKHPSLYVFLSIIMLLGFSLLLNQMVNREKFFQRKSYLPALSFLIFTSLLPVLNVFSMVFIANLLLFLAFSKTMQLYHMQNPRKMCFDIGFLVSLAALFYFPSILFFFLFLALLLLLRPFKLQENIAYLLGILAPVYFGFSILFLSGAKPIPFLHLTPPIYSIQSNHLLIITIASIVMLVYGLFLVNQAGLKNAIAVRKKWNGVVLYLIFASAIGCFSTTFPGIPWLLTIAPISIILSQTFLNSKEKYNTFTFYFLLLLVFVVQWIK